MFDWLKGHETLLLWLAAASVVMFVGTLLLTPWIVTRIPADYFAHDRRPAHTGRSRLAAVTLRVVKNLLGVIFILAGIAMLVLPGQGLLTILIGMFLTDYPGKYRLERWLITRPTVLNVVNALRARRKCEPLRFTDAEP